MSTNMVSKTQLADEIAVSIDEAFVEYILVLVPIEAKAIFAANDQRTSFLNKIGPSYPKLLTDYCSFGCLEAIHRNRVGMNDSVKHVSLMK